MTLETGICLPFIASGGLSLGQQINKQTYTSTSKDNVSIHTQAKNIKSEPIQQANPQTTNTIANNDKFTKEEGHQINKMAYPIFSSGASGQEIVDFINQYKDNPKKQAKIIASILDASGRGMGTREQCMAAAVYSINNETYPMVQESMKKILGLTIEELLSDELSESESQDLFRHLNQFKNQLKN